MWSWLEKRHRKIYAGIQWLTIILGLAALVKSFAG